MQFEMERASKNNWELKYSFIQTFMPILTIIIDFHMAIRITNLDTNYNAGKNPIRTMNVFSCPSFVSEYLPTPLSLENLKENLQNRYVYSRYLHT